MTITLTLTEAYDRGRTMAEGLLPNLPHKMQSDYAWAKSAYLGAEDLDLPEAVLQFSRERMAADLDLAQYPECRGVRELVEAQRKGVHDAVSDPYLAANLLDWYYFCSRRLNTRYVGRQKPPSQCTSYAFHDTREGGPILGGNVDDLLFRYVGQGFKASHTPKGSTEPQSWDVVTCIGGVSSAVLCDEEPECLFPVDLAMVIPEGITDLKEYVGYLERYRDFWGPGNQLWTDGKGAFAAIEKANVRMGVRYSDGWGAITACSYVTPDMNAFKKERDLLSYQARGWDPEDNMDRAYWDGDESRYRRLLQLCEGEHARGATLLGAAAIGLDHAVPFPARVCISGERGHRDEEENYQNWTLISYNGVLNGPNTRQYIWVNDPDDPKPIYETACMIAPGQGAEDRLPAWEAEVRAAGEIGG